MSLLKFSEDPELSRGNGRGPVSFNRAHIDGMPFRGRAPMLREEEWEDLTETVVESGTDLFDLSVPEHKKKFEYILEASVNGWWTVHLMREEMVVQKDGTVKVFVFCIWSVPYKELAKHRTPSGILSQPLLTS